MTELVLALFLVCLSASVVAHVSPRRLGEWLWNTPLLFIPRWTFFAPYPGVRDYQILARCRIDDGSISEWRELLFAEPRTIVGSLWNPPKRVKKKLYFALRILVQSAPRHGPQGIVSTPPYLTVLSYVVSLLRRPDVQAVQFMVVRSYGFVTSREPRRLIVSKMHEL